MQLNLESTNYNHISKVVDKTNERIELIRSGKLKPLVTSSRKEKEKIGGLYPTDQMVLAARTGMGKTAKVIHMMRDFVDPRINPHYNGKLIILYDTWEMADFRSVLRMYSREAQMTVKQLLDFQNTITEEQFTRLKLIGDSFKGYPIYMSQISQSVNAWKKQKIEITNKYPKHTIVNIVDHTRLVSRDNEGSEEQLISKFMMAGMKIKNDYEHINIFLSQMNRNIESGARGRDDIGKNTPVSSDIFGSDSVFQCADIVMALHRPGFYGLTSWEDIPTGINPNNPDQYDHLMIECILKQRDGWTGNLMMRHNLGFNQIEDY